MLTLGRFGMKRFASAVMWVLREAFASTELSTGDPQNPDQNPTDGSILREPQDRRQLTTRNLTENRGAILFGVVAQSLLKIQLKIRLMDSTSSPQEIQTKN